MKILLRILLAPVFALLTMLIWIATKIMEISAVVPNFIAIGTVLGAICIIIDGRTASGIAGLVAALFLTPFGLPLLAMLILEGVKSIKRRVQECGKFFFLIRQQFHCAVADIDQVDQHFNPFVAPHHVAAKRPECFPLIIAGFNIPPE